MSADQTSGKPLEALWAWMQRQFGNNVLMLSLFSGLLLFTGFRGRDTVGEVVDDRIQPVRRQVEEHEQKLRHIVEDFHEIERDNREIYRVMPRMRDSSRLEKPWPGHDGGEP